MTPSDKERFYSKIHINEETRCWDWIGNQLPAGYGLFKLNGKMILAHRLSYSLCVGDIPVGLQLDHLCRNKRCVNPNHLEPVTAAENMFRAKKSHCKRGHEFTEENTYVSKRGARHCRSCHNEKERKRRAIKRQEKKGE